MAPRDFINQQLEQTISSNSPSTLMGFRGVLRFNNVPTWLVYVVIIAVVASWIPLAGAVRGKFVKSPLPRIHLIQDMDNQSKYKTQTVNPVFANGMSMRPLIPGTVSVGHLDDDDFFYRGFKIVGTNADGSPDVEYAGGFPSQVKVTPELLAKGKELWARYCYLCHGYDGYGNGPVHVRAKQHVSANPNWIPPSSMHADSTRGRPDGHIYNTINNGIRSMAGYGTQITAPEDRWAIVAYVRALQVSQDARPDLIPEGLRDRTPVKATVVDGKPLGTGETADQVTPPGTTAVGMAPTTTTAPAN